MSIIKSKDPEDALERFSRESVFREIRYIVIDESIHINQSFLREFLEKNKLIMINKTDYEELNELMSREILDKIISFIQKHNM